MKPDLYFTGLGCAFLVWSIYLLYASFFRGIRHRRIAALLWTAFSAGLLLQGLTPPLKVVDNAFVIPPSLNSLSTGIDPAGIVARERRIRLLVGLLTMGASLGLAYCYRRDFVSSRASQKAVLSP